MYFGRSSSREGEKPKARYIQENAKALRSGPFYPTTLVAIKKCKFFTRKTDFIGFIIKLG